MRRALLVLLAALGVAAALGVTASSTMTQAQRAGMTGTVAGFAVALCLVVVLEVVNIAGTWTWLGDNRPRVRVEAAVGVALASLVTGTCGAVTYGPLGLVAPVGSLAATHLLSRLLTPSTDTGEDTATDTAASEQVTETVHVQDAPSPPPSDADQPDLIEPTSEPVAGPPQEPEPAAVSAPTDNELDVDPRVREIAELLAARCEITGPQAAALHQVSERTGRRLLADARAHLEQHPITPPSPFGLHLVEPATAGGTA